jgi:hypothetical protein
MRGCVGVIKKLNVREHKIMIAELIKDTSVKWKQEKPTKTCGGGEGGGMGFITYLTV